MKSIHLSTSFNSKDFEEPIYDLWKENNCFLPSGTGDPFVVVIPPPNVTGILHIGHGLNNTLQDTIVRYQRMMGRNTLWIPGTDHAGIATQSVVEKKLLREGTSRQEIGRDSFVQQTWELCNQHKHQIENQLEKLGASCDWSRYRFTLDPGLSRAVSEVFIHLYKKGLIYRGNYMVNWSVQNQTAISNEEVEYKETVGHLYYLRYVLADGSGEISIATTRPETIFGDCAVAVHPDDPRYSAHIGKKVIVPLTERAIPIVTEAGVDQNFGTGALKVTPAHDQFDYEIGLKHNLELRIIMTEDGRLNELVPAKYQGLKMLEARKKIAEDLTENFLIQKKEHRHQVGYCHRTGDIIEPFPSQQWFVKMQPLAQLALESWERNEIRFYPEKWANTYLSWLNNIRDWCISRQLWWGHRIPVWYDNETGEMLVSADDPAELPEYAGRAFTQDESVLDTWFSSWLWPMSTMGWPEKTADLAQYYPTTTLITGYDIIFFWVARMIMAGLEFTKQLPFRDIYITQLLRDKKGRKMSKSLGNGIDPRQVIDEVGADALRFTLTFMAAQGADILLDKDDFQFGSKFSNKIWNASRYILMHLEDRTPVPFDDIQLEGIDLWLYHRLNEAVTGVHAALKQYRFNDASHDIYEFFWNDFCDWYLEASKLHLYGTSESGKDRIVSLLLYFLEEILRLLHPFMPFISEEIYQRIPAEFRSTSSFLIQAEYPQEREERIQAEHAEYFAQLQSVVRSIRTIRSQFNIPFSRAINFTISHREDWSAARYVRDSIQLIRLLTNGDEINFAHALQRQENAIVSVAKNFEAHIFIRDMIDIDAELQRLIQSVTKKQKILAQCQAKLANEKFIKNAKEDVIIHEQNKERELTDQIEKNKKLIHELEQSS